MLSVLLLAEALLATSATLPLSPPPQPVDISGEWLFRIDPADEGLAAGWYTADADETGWRTIRVPGSWEKQGVTAESAPGYSDWRPYNGPAWYRTRVSVPDEWKGYDLRLLLGRIDDKDTCFWNGQKIGASDKVDVERAYRISADLVRTGPDANLLAVRVVDIGGDGGIFPGPVRLSPVMPWEDTELSAAPGEADGVYSPGEAISLGISARNALDEQLPVRLQWTVEDTRAATVASGAEDWPLPPGPAQRRTVLLPTLPMGHYDVRLELMAGGVTVKQSLSSFAVLEPPAAGWNSPDSPFGLNGGALFHLSEQSLQKEGGIRMAQSALVGASWGRNDFWWSVIEPEKGRFDWSRADRAVQMYTDAGVNLMIILCYASAWSGGAPPADDEERAAFAAYAKAMVERYRDRVRCWEVWNEPNIPEFWRNPNPDDYAKLLETTYKAVKEADPAATVVGCATAGCDLGFIRRVLEAGGGQWMDVCSVHPYQAEAAHLGGEYNKILELAEMLRANGTPMPIWITEMGWPTVGGLSERRQADMVSKLYATSLAGPFGQVIGKVFYFNLTDWGKRGTGEGGHFGLAHMDNTPKPSFLAYAASARLLGGTAWEKDLDLGEGVAAHLFRKGQQRVLVAWRDKGEKAQLHIPWEGPAEAYDVFGLPMHARRCDGAVVVELGGSPVYIVGRSPSPGPQE